MLFNIYTNDQPQSEGTHHFIYADDFGAAVQDNLTSVFLKKRFSNTLRARSQIPVVSMTGRTPGWPGALKLPGATV